MSVEAEQRVESPVRRRRGWRWAVAGLAVAGVIAWGVARAEAVDAAPTESVASPGVVYDLLDGYELVDSSCQAPQAWSSVDRHPALALELLYEGSAHPCVSLLRFTDEANAGVDYYAAFVSVDWSREAREGRWGLDFGGAAEPAFTVGVRSTVAAVGNRYRATAAEDLPCNADGQGGVVFRTMWSSGTVDGLAMGTCRGRAALESVDESSATWTVARPEQWDQLAVIYSFGVDEGEMPELELTFEPRGAEG